MSVPIPSLKHLQPKQYLSWLRRATDPEWDEERFGCGSRSKAERAAAAFALELSEAFECIAALTQERDQMQSKLALLTDPAAVHANILRGALPLTKAQAIHIAGLPANVEQELERLRAALLQIGRDADCVLRDDVSTDFLLHLPEEMRLQRQKLRTEVERLGRPVTDEEASDAVTAAMKMEFGGTYQEAMEALITARRKP